MPRKMEQYSVPFNDVSLDLVGLIRRRREEGDVVTDTLAVMNKWAFECKEMKRKKSYFMCKVLTRHRVIHSLNVGS